MSADNIYGWIPNFDGKVCCEANVRSKIDDAVCECALGKGTMILNAACSYSYDVSGRTVTVSNDSCGTIEIDILNEGGICSLRITENKIKSDKGTKIWVGEVWAGFRKMVDGCSETVCDCTAMVPVYLGQDQSVYERIAEMFIETIGNEADFACRIVGRIINEKNEKSLDNWEALWDKSRKLQNVSKANRLYFERFLDIYKDEFSPQELDELRKMMNAGFERAKIAYDDNMRESEFGFKRESDKLNRRRFYIALASLVIAVLAFVGLR